MKLKGLENYDVRFDGDDITVWSNTRRRFIKPVQKGYIRAFQLWSRNKNRSVSFGMLRFLRDHPDIDATTINLRRQRIKFADDGTVLDLYSEKRRPSYNNFKNLEDVIETANLLIACRDGSIEPIINFIHVHREAAICAVASLLKLSANKVRCYAEAGEEKFLKETRTANVRRFLPLYAWLCKCIKCAVKESIINIEDSRMDGTLRMTTCQSDTDV